MEKKNNKSNNKKMLIGIIIGCLILIFIVILLLKGCSPKVYEVNFDTNGGSKTNNVKINENSKIEKPDDPTKDGYIFEGWYYNGKLFDFNTKIDKNITLEARWREASTLHIGDLSLKVNGTGTLEIISLPEGLSKEDLVFTSSDETIATVNELGLVTALKLGTVTITVKSKTGNYSASCTVKVLEDVVEVESISINGRSTVNVGSKIKLTVKYSPENAANQSVKWEVDKPEIASIDSDGNVTGLKAGTVVVTATTSNGKTATKKITIKDSTTQANPTNPETPSAETPQPQVSTVGVTGITISGDNQVAVGSNITLIATITPDNATDKSLTWESSDNNIASVNNNGVVTGKSAGTVTITVRASNGVSATYTVTVYKVAATYVLHLQGIPTEGISDIYDYKFWITKDGVVFNDYLGFKINNHDYSKATDSSNNKITSVHIETNNVATITLSNRTKETMLVQFD